MRVVNASPLIVLSKIARLDLLREPRPGINVAVPRTVVEEVMRGDPGDPAVTLVPAAVADWLQVVPTPSVDDSIRKSRLDPGEIAVLSVVVAHPGWEAVLDDRAARREAARLGVPCIGTVGLILTGYRLGLVPSVLGALQKLRGAGLFISDDLLQRAVDQVGG